MLISVKEASKKLNVSERTIQLKCKQNRIVKIGNQYQITNDILNAWIYETKTETKRNEIQISRKQPENNFVLINLFKPILASLFVLVCIIMFYLFYCDITNKNTIQEQQKEIVKQLEEKKTLNNKIERLYIDKEKLKDTIYKLKTTNKELIDYIKIHSKNKIKG